MILTRRTRCVGFRDRLVRNLHKTWSGTCSNLKRKLLPRFHPTTGTHLQRTLFIGIICSFFFFILCTPLLFNRFSFSSVVMLRACCKCSRRVGLWRWLSQRHKTGSSLRGGPVWLDYFQGFNPWMYLKSLLFRVYIGISWAIAVAAINASGTPKLWLRE